MELKTQGDIMNPFRDPKTNIRYLQALFWETNRTGKHQVVYTLKDVDHKGYPSLYLLYMQEGDLTEYEFANKYLDGWDHWTSLCECTWFKPYVERWRHELDLRYRARALRRIEEEAEDKNSKSHFTANKFILEGGWKEKKEKGRPSKDDIKKAAKEQADFTNQLKEDWELINDAQEESKSVH